MPIYNDNQSAVQWAKGKTTKKMKWIDLRENFVRTNILGKTISVQHIPGLNNLSDIFTKESHDISRFLALRDSFVTDSPGFAS